MQKVNMKQYDIRQAQLNDIAKCAKIENHTFSEPWSEKSFFDALHDSNYLFYVLCEDMQPIGYFVAENICDEINLYTIAIEDKHKGNGYGQALMQHLIEIAKSVKALLICLEVRISNMTAISLYKKNGFIQTGVRHNFYKKPSEDAYLFTLNLNNEEEK